MQQEQIDKIKQLAQEVSDREGCVLYDVEFIGAGRHRTLRVLVDGKTEQVSIDQCANVSRGLSLLLDVEDIVGGGAYDLEVSSPGIERPLREAWHFERAVGKTVSLVTHTTVAPFPSPAIKGVLKSAAGETIVVQVGEADHTLNLADVKKAKIIFEMVKSGPNNKPGKGPKR